MALYQEGWVHSSCGMTVFLCISVVQKASADYGTSETFDIRAHDLPIDTVEKFEAFEEYLLSSTENRDSLVHI